MTNREAVIAVAGTVIPDNNIDKVLTDLGLYPTSSYTLANAAKIDLVTIEVLRGILAMPDITEGGYSIKYDRGAIAKRITSIEVKNGIIVARPTVRALKVW